MMAALLAAAIVVAAPADAVSDALRRAQAAERAGDSALAVREARAAVSAVTDRTPPQDAAAARALLGRLLASDDPDAALPMLQTSFASMQPGSFARAEAEAAFVVASCGAKGLPACADGIAPAAAALRFAPPASVTERERGAQMLSNLANLAQAAGRTTLAAETLDTAMALVAADPQDSGPAAAIAYANAAYQVIRTGEMERAIGYLGRAIGILERARGRDSAALVDPLTVLGEALIRSGRYAEAGEALRRAVAIADATPAIPVTPHVFALTTLGGFYAQTGRRAAGLALFDRSMALGESDPAVARQMAGVYRNVASIHVEMENWDRARALLDKALVNAEGAAGKSSSAYGGVLIDIADLEFRRGRLGEAAGAANGARDAFAKALDTKNPRNGDPVLILAKVAEARGDHAGAAPLFDAALKAMATRAPSSLALITAQMSAGQCYAMLDARNPNGFRLARRAADAMTARLVAEAQIAGVTTPTAASQPDFYDTALTIGWTAVARAGFSGNGASSPPFPRW